MSTLTKELKVRISADANGLKGVLNGISNDISKVGKDFEGLKKLGEGVSNIGKKLTMGLTLPIVGMGTASAKTAMDFESAMNEVSAISGATGKDLEKLENLAKDMGASTKFSASESAEALKYMGMAGWKTEDMLSGLPGILNLASAGGTDLATTSDIVTDGLTAMGLTAKDTDKFVDIMASTVSNANTNIELMGETLKYVGPVAGSLGIEMDDLSVAIGLMGNAGLKGSQAGTSLRAGLTNLVKPTKEMRNAMEKYGVELVKNSDGSVDLMGTMENLRSTLGGLEQTTQAQALASIFGKEAMSGWASIVNASEGDFNKLTEAIANSDGTAQSMADTMMGGAKGALTEMKSALEGVAIIIGERLTPFIEKLADGVSKVCDWFKNLSPATQTFIMIVAGLLALLGPLLLLIGGAISLFANLSIFAGALGISFKVLCVLFLKAVGIIAGIIAIGFLLVKNWDKIKKACKDFVKTFKNNFNKLKKDMTSVWKSIQKTVSDAWDKICNLVKVGVMFIGEIFKMAFQIITLPWKFIWENCKNIIIPIWESIKNYIIQKLNELKAKVSEIANNIKDYISNKFNELKIKVSEIANNIKDYVVNKFNELKTKVSEIWNAIKTYVINKATEIKDQAIQKFQAMVSPVVEKFNEIKTNASEIFGNIKKAITDKINDARDAVEKAIDKIKGFFDFEWELPKIKLPHFSISGKFSLDPPSAPKFKVDWYSKGAIFKRPTVLGGMGVGDAHNGIGSGAEAILPINQLPKLLGLDKMQENNNNPIVVNTILDGKTIAQTIASYSDVVSGNRMNLAERGLAL